MDLITENNPITVYQIYVITNTVTGKKYIGQTIGSLRNRWSQHKSTAKRRLKLNFHHSIALYGPEMFIIEPVAFTFTKSHADQLEEEWIIRLNTTDRNFGYNYTFGGEGARHVPETCEKISLSKIGKPGRKFTDEERQACSERQKGEKGNNFGKSASEETRKKMSLSHSGENNHCFGLVGELHPHFGHRHTEEHKENIRLRMSGPNNPNYGKRGIDAPGFGRIVSDEARKKISDSAKLRVGPLNPFFGKKHNEQARANMKSGQVRRREIEALRKLFDE